MLLVCPPPSFVVVLGHCLVQPVGIAGIGYSAPDFSCLWRLSKVTLSEMLWATVRGHTVKSVLKV